MDNLLLYLLKGISRDNPVIPLLSFVFQKGYILSEKQDFSDPDFTSASYFSGSLKIPVAYK